MKMDFLKRTQLVREKPKNQHQLFYIEAMMKERKSQQKKRKKGGSEGWRKEKRREEGRHMVSFGFGTELPLKIKIH